MQSVTSNAVASVTKTIETGSGIDGLYAYRCGQIVWLRLYSSQRASSSVVLGVLPERFRPITVLRTALMYNVTRTPVGMFLVRTNGNVELYNLASDGEYVAEVCYITNN